MQSLRPKLVATPHFLVPCLQVQPQVCLTFKEPCTPKQNLDHLKPHPTPFGGWAYKAMGVGPNTDSGPKRFFLGGRPPGGLCPPTGKMPCWSGMMSPPPKRPT